MSTNLKLLCSHKSLDIRLKFSLCNMVRGGSEGGGQQLVSNIRQQRVKRQNRLIITKRTIMMWS